MRIVRFKTGSKVKYGVLEDSMVRGFRVSPFARFKGSGSTFDLDGSTYKLSEVKLLSPCTPSKIIGMGLNYHAHVKETGMTVPPVPLFFIKPSTAVVGPDDEIVLPYLDKRIDYEGELAVVIGKKAKNVPEKSAKDYVLGYTCIHDATERDAQASDVQWTRSKSFDTFGPIGPWIETKVDPEDLKLETYLNGELRQSARTSDLIFGVPKLVNFISSVMTLLPGDVIATGTPAGIAPMKPGDVIEIKIEKIGTLRNTVVGPK
ncbi:fumarylacetoacetate hydrolase family protein [Chloroflexota bacterium]